MEIQSHMVPVNIHKTPSTTKNSTRAYYFSLIEHLKRILQNPTINSKLYFGPGIEAEEKRNIGMGISGLNHHCLAKTK